MNQIIQAQIEKELKSHELQMAGASFEYVQHFRALEKKLCGSLTRGFEAVYKRTINSSKTISEGSTDLQKISALFEWDFAKIIEQNKISNVLLEDIAQLLNIPDKEKVRKAAIEKGLTFLKQATVNTEFYADAKRFFEEALACEDIDYYVLYNLGLIYLFSDHELNPERAKQFFLKSAKYAAVGITFSQPSHAKRLSSFNQLIDPKTISGNAQLYAARASYSLNKLDEAIEEINEAITIDNENIDFLFDKSIYMLEKRNVELSVNLLRKILKQDYLIVLKLLKNKKMVQNESIRDMLNELADEALNKAKQESLNCEKLLNPKDDFRERLNEINELIKIGTYLSACEALKLLFPNEGHPLSLQIKNQHSTATWLDQEISFYQMNYPKQETLQAKVSKIHTLIAGNSPSKNRAIKEILEVPFTIDYEINYGKLEFFDYSNITFRLKEHVQFDLECLPLLLEKKKLMTKLFNLSLKKITKGGLFSNSANERAKLADEKSKTKRELADINDQIEVNWSKLLNKK